VVRIAAFGSLETGLGNTSGLCNPDPNKIHILYPPPPLKRCTEKQVANNMQCPRKPTEAASGSCTCTSQVAERLRNLQASDCNPQNQSPLFNTLPGEIRNIIFNFALSEYDSAPINREAYYYRPDYPAFRKISTTLLQTCRRIYLETRVVAPRNVQSLRFWLGSADRAPPFGKLPAFTLRNATEGLIAPSNAPLGMDYRIYREYEPWMWLVDDVSDSEYADDESDWDNPTDLYRFDIFESANDHEENMLDLLFGKSCKLFNITMTLMYVRALY
jgi:hypothetical protein